MTLATPATKFTKSPVTTSIPTWMTLESALDIISDHYEWNPSSTTKPTFGILNQEPKERPIRTEKPFIWGVYKITGERTTDGKIKLIITRAVETTKVVKVNEGKGDEGKKVIELKEIPLRKGDFTLLSKKRFILVDHRTGASTEPKKFRVSNKGSGRAEIIFDLKKDFVIPKKKALPETNKRLEQISWVKNCYTLVQAN